MTDLVWVRLSPYLDLLVMAQGTNHRVWLDQQTSELGSVQFSCSVMSDSL